ncbi:MAG: 7-cyano-7-deazaguanine synthase, partial [Desulfurellales bacterium]
MNENDRSVVVLSGGMDSTTALYVAIGESAPIALSFDYGQRHRKELKSAALICADLGIEHHIIDLTSLTQLIATSALTDPNHQVPEGHYADDNMKQTVVPNRNAIMANIAIGVAVARKARYVFLGVHAGDHAVYPDCRPEFIDSLQSLAE